MHAGQLTVSVETVSALVDQQFPQWRELRIEPVRSQGTVNALFRLGDSLVARFPLGPGEAGALQRTLEAEAAAAGELLGRTRVPTPEPVALGQPGLDYPLPWSVQTWLSGSVASDCDAGSEVEFAHDLAEFVRDVRAIPLRGRSFRGVGRGGHLPDHDEWMRTCLERSEALLDVGAVRSLWARLRELPPSPGGDRMTHGDLIPANVLVADGRLVGVIDVGGAGPADPALDLVGAWHLLEAGPRAVLRADLRCGDVEWARGAAWALEQAMGVVWYYVESNPAMHRMGRRTVQRLLRDEPSIPW